MGGSTVYAHAHARRARMQYELLASALDTCHVKVHFPGLINISFSIPC